MIWRRWSLRAQLVLLVLLPLVPLLGWVGYSAWRLAGPQIAGELSVLGLLMLLACTLAWRIAGSAILVPARQILAAAQQLQNGDPHIRIGTLPRVAARELAGISGSLDLMADALQRRERQHEEDVGQSRHARQLLDLVLNSMQETVIAVDATGRLILRNQAAASLLSTEPPGIGAAQWPARYGLCHTGTDRLLTQPELPTSRALRGETGRDLDIDGHHLQVPGVRTLRCSFRPMHREGAVVGAVVVITDITDLRALQLEQARNLADLRELQRKLGQAQEIGKIGYWEFDIAMERLWWSDETHALFGITPDAFDGSFASMLASVHPEDRANFVVQRDRVLSADEVFETEFRIVRPDGAVRWIHQIGRMYYSKRGRAVRRAGVVQDITARKTAEQALAASELRYTALFRQGPLPMWVMDRRTAQFLAVNEAALAQYGHSREAFASLTLRDIQPAQARLREDLYPDRTRDIQAGGDRWMHRRQDGSEFPVKVVSRVVPYQDHDAEFVVALDISDRVKAETEVQDYVFTLQRAADAAQAITQQPSLRGTLQEVVEQARGVVGAHQAAITISQSGTWAVALSALSLSEKYAQWQDAEMPRPSGGGIFALVCETNRPVRLTQAELEAHPRWRGLGADTNRHPPLRGWLAVPLVGADGRNMGVLQLSDKYEGEFSARDVYVASEMAHLATAALEKARLIEEVRSLNADLEARIAHRTAELARQEALFRALAEQAPQAVWTADTAGAATYFNRHWYELVGGEPLDWLGHGWARLQHPDDRAAVRRNWAQACSEGTTFVGVRRILARDGRYHSMSYRAAPVLDAQGAISFWVGIDTDITELKAVETALVQSNRELEAFSYSVSHDLRSPLNTIDGFSRLLERQLEGAADPKTRHCLSRVRAGVAQMGQLIEGLLSLAQVQRASLHREPVDLGALARDVLERLQERQPARRVALRIEDGLVAEGDPRLLRSVMENLLGNAWKFTSNCEHALIEVGRLPDQQVFFVRDNGAGFDMAYSDKLFGVFQRLHSAAEFPGTGVGLATVQRIIARHGGKVWAESAPGAGATFFFMLVEPPPAPTPPPIRT
jgi:PAS domain S-box-containing protein